VDDQRELIDGLLPGPGTFVEVYAFAVHEAGSTLVHAIFGQDVLFFAFRSPAAPTGIQRLDQTLPSVRYFTIQLRVGRSP